MSEVQDVDVIDQATDKEIINLKLKITDLQEAIEATLNNKHNNLSKALERWNKPGIKGLVCCIETNSELIGYIYTLILR